MKKYQQTNRGKSKAHLFGRNRQLPLRFYGALEPLEQRHLLAANVLDSTIGTIETSTDTDAVQMIVTLPDAPGATASLLLQMNSRNGSSLDSIAPLILDGDGDAVPSVRMNNAGGLDGRTMVELGEGTYTVVADGQAGSMGEYELVASLLGDVETDDGTVSEFEKLRASAALVQYLGAGSIVTDHFYRSRGIDLSVDQYDAGMDANANGVVEQSDFAMVESNFELGSVGVQFISDTTPPGFSQLMLVNPVNDMGQVDDATVSGIVTDEVGVTQLNASLDDDPLQDITSQVTIGADGSFTIPQSLLDQLAGGTLANGEHTLNLSAVDEFDNENDPPVEFSFNIFRNFPPIIDPISDQMAEEDLAFSLDIGALVSDPNGDDLSIAVTQSNGDDGVLPIDVSPLPDWLTYDTVTRILSGTPAESDLGTFTVSILVSDPIGATAVTSFNITVANTNDPPMLDSEIGDQMVNEGQQFSLDTSSNFSDPDPGDQLTFLLAAPGADWLSIDAATGVISGVADDADVGTVEVTVTARDLVGEEASDTFELVVNDVPEDPVVDDQSFVADPEAENGTVFGTVQASDEDAGDTLSYAIIGGNTGNAFAIDESSGELSIADADMVNEGDEFDLTVEVTDSTGLTDTAVISILVTDNFDPTAVNDDGFSTEDVVELDLLFEQVLINDTDPDGDPLTVTEVSATSAQGATVTLDMANEVITYDPTSVDALVELAEGDSIADTFTYTVSDGRGGMDTATVTVTVLGTGPTVQFVLRTFDAEGMPTTAVDPGDTFELRVFVQDISAAGDGVFSAFLDVTYTTGLATPGEIDHLSGDYDGAPSGSTSTAGLLDEVGGLNGQAAFNPIGDGEFEVFRIEFTAGMDDGFMVFNSNPAEDVVQHPVLLIGETANTLEGQIVFGTTSVAIGAVSPASRSASAPTLTNPANPFDVNDDGLVTPLDALMVINHVAGIEGPSMYYDVNGDAVGSPIDVLMVINEMVSDTVDAPLSSGNITSDDGSSIAVDELFAAVADDSIQLGQPWGELVDFLQDNSNELVSELMSQLDEDTDPEDLADWNDWLVLFESLV